MSTNKHHKKLLASIIEDIVACPADHPYLLTTGNSGAKCGMYKGHEVVAGVQCHGYAAMVIRDTGGKPANVLFQRPHEASRFDHLLLFGENLAGCYVRIGEIKSAILVVEDVESGLALQFATALGTAVSLYSENISAVVASLRKKYADKRIIVCAGAYGAGDIRSNEPFVIKAAIQNIAGVAIPDSGDNFNVLFRSHGEDHVTRILYAAGAPVSKNVLEPTREDLIAGPPVQWPWPIYGSALMERLLAAFKRHVVLSDQQILAISLWVILTHLVDAVRVLPILALVSPVRRCGKTTLLGIIQVLVSRGLLSSNITSASLFRVVDEWRPTLIIDEADTFLAKSEELVGIVNAGHTRDTAFVYRMASGNKPRRFDVFCPKAIAGIGHRSPTITDRSIVIVHQRKRQEEKVEKYRASENDDLVALRAQVARWAADNLDAVRTAKFDLPSLPSDRAQDNWEPLLAIASCLGDCWLERATQAAEELSVIHDRAMCSGEELLRDIRASFSSRGRDKIFTYQLIDDLCSDPDKPWATFNRTKPVTPRQISKLLENFEIEPGDVRIGSEVKKGYVLFDFEDAFARYVAE